MTDCNVWQEFISFIQCFYISIREIPAADVLMYVTIILAYLAYRRTKIDSIDSWYSLFKSLKTDIDFQKNWLWGDYRNGHEDKNFYSPKKIVFNLSFESLKSIIQKGIYSSFLKDNQVLEKQLSVFNERIEAFNQMLNYQRSIISSNPLLSYKLYLKLCKIGLKNDNVSFVEFEKALDKMRYCFRQCYYLSKKIKEINDIIHIDLISYANRIDEGKEYCLSYISKDIYEKLLPIIDKPSYKWYLANSSLRLSIILIISTIIFYFIEIFFH